MRMNSQRLQKKVRMTLLYVSNLYMHHITGMDSMKSAQESEDRVEEYDQIEEYDRIEEYNLVEEYGSDALSRENLFKNVMRKVMISLMRLMFDG